MSITCQRVREMPALQRSLAGRIGVLIPAYNEAEHLPAVLAACRAIRPAVVMVVDDGSQDETPAVMAREEGADPSGVLVRYLRNPTNLGKQGTVARGLRELAAHDLDGVALIDGDGQHDPRELPGLAVLLADHDLVIGARLHDAMPRRRRFSNWLCNAGFRVIGGVDFVDVQSGLRLYRKPIADLLGLKLPVDGRYALEHESLAIVAEHASRRGLELCAVAAPITCAYGVSRSSMRARNMLELGGETVRQAWRIRHAQRARLAEEQLPRAMTVEIHDVTPAARGEALSLAQAIAELGVARPTLLVVPRFEDATGRGWDLRQDPVLLEWLREKQAAGAEIVQHGLTHRAPAPPPPGLASAFMHHWFSRGCAEFAHLSREEAADRLLCGRRILAECGLRADGFIAPAWQQSPAALEVLGSLGYRFTAFLDRVLPLTGEAPPVTTPALTFAAPSPLLDRGKRVVMRGLEELARPTPLLRVVLHPEDLHGARPVGHIVRRVRALLRHRRVVTYSQWLDERANLAAA